MRLGSQRVEGWTSGGVQSPQADDDSSTSTFMSGQQNHQNSRFVSFEGTSDLLGYSLVYKIAFIFFVSAKTAVTGKLKLGLCREFIFRNIE